MRIFSAILAAFRRMPTGVRVLTVACLLLVLPLPIACVPGMDFQIGDQPVSFSEFWRRGGGLVFCCVGAYFSVVAYGLIRARRWSRPMLVLGGSGLVLVGTLSEGRLSTDTIVGFVVLALCPGIYLYFRQAARRYFASNYEFP